MEDRCVMCGDIIPEDRQVCLNCEHKIMEGKYDGRTAERTKDKVPTED